MNKIIKKLHIYANQKDHKVFFILIEKWFDFIGWLTISSLLLAAYFLTGNLIFKILNIISIALLSFFVNFVLFTYFFRKIKVKKLWILLFFYIIQIGIQTFLQLVIVKAIYTLFLISLLK